MLKKKEIKNEVSNAIIESVLKMVYETPNFCEKIMELKNFENQYKGSEFYQKTKIDLFVLYKEYSAEIKFSPKEILNYLQKHIDELKLDNLEKVLNEFVHETDKTYADTINSAQEIGLSDKLKEAGIIK